MFFFSFFFLVLVFCHIYLFIFSLIIVFLSFVVFLLLSLVYTFLRIALSPAMNEDHECHDRVRPKVFLLFCFHFCGIWHPPRNRPTIQVKNRALRKGVQAVLSPNCHILYGGLGTNGVRGIFARAFCLYMGFTLYISIVFNSITLNSYFLYILYILYIFFSCSL